MSNLIVNSSEVIRHNLITLRSEVQETTLILHDPPKYVERFAPDVLKNNDTMQALYKAEKDEITELVDKILYIKDSAFIKTANYNRLMQWEKILQITANEYDDLENRKMNIIQKIAFRPPYTRQNFKSILADIWGDGDYTFEINYDEYLIVIDIHANDPQLYLSFQETIRNIVPANMVVIFSIQLFVSESYIQHGGRRLWCD